MKTNIAMNRDVDAAHKRGVDLKFQRYQERLDRDLAFFRTKILTLALLTALATLAWSLASTENGKQVCELISQLFK